MWSKTYSKKVKGLKAEKIWKVWADVNHWHTWQDDIDYAKMDGEFKVGNTFALKPKWGSVVKIALVKVEPNKGFTDLTCFPLAKMYGEHEFTQHGDTLEIKTAVRVEGPLAFVWRKLVAEGVAKGMEAQTESLIVQARHG